MLSLMVLLVNGLFLRTLPNVSDFFQPLESIIIQEFIPAVIGKFVSDLERDLFALSVRMGEGLGCVILLLLLILNIPLLYQLLHH